MSAQAAAVRRYYELVDADDVEGLIALFAPDAVYSRPGYEPFRGHEALRAFYSGDRVIESGRHTVEVLVDGTTNAVQSGIAVHGTFVGQLKDGSQVSLRFADFYTFDEAGRFATRDTFFYSPMV